MYNFIFSILLKIEDKKIIKKIKKIVIKGHCYVIIEKKLLVVIKLI